MVHVLLSASLQEVLLLHHHAAEGVGRRYAQVRLPSFLLSPLFFFSFYLTLPSAPSSDRGCYPSFLPHLFSSSSFRSVILQKMLLRDMTRSCNHSSLLLSLFAFLVFLSHRHAAEGASKIHDQVMQPLLFLSSFALLLFVIVKSPRDHLHVLGVLRFMSKT